MTKECRICQEHKRCRKKVYLTNSQINKSTLNFIPLYFVNYSTANLIDFYLQTFDTTRGIWDPKWFKLNCSDTISHITHNLASRILLYGIFFVNQFYKILDLFSGDKICQIIFCRCARNFDWTNWIIIQILFQLYRY